MHSKVKGGKVWIPESEPNRKEEFKDKLVFTAALLLACAGGVVAAIFAPYFYT